MLESMESSSSPSDQAGPRSRGGHTATKEMKKCTENLEEALRNCKIQLNLSSDDVTGSSDVVVECGRVVSAMSCLSLARHWAAFMKKVCDTFSKVLKNHCT